MALSFGTSFFCIIPARLFLLFSRAKTRPLFTHASRGPARTGRGTIYIV